MKNQVKPLLSIIIPVYNAHNTLNRCLDSVINQDYQKLQIITINDGSTDNSLDILNEYKEKDSRIIVISQKNGGMGNAINTGIRIIDGEYYTYLDSDDELIPNALNKIMEEVIKHPKVEIIGFSYEMIKNNKAKTIIRSPLNEVLTDKNAMQLGLFSNEKLNQISRITTAQWGKIYSSKFKNIFFSEDLKANLDVNYAINIFSHCNAYMSIDIKGLKFYDTADSINKKESLRPDIGKIRLDLTVYRIKNIKSFTNVALEKIILQLLNCISLDTTLKGDVKEIIKTLPKLKISTKVKILKTIATTSPKFYKIIFNLLMYIKKR